jgi:hypothetical protein
MQLSAEEVLDLAQRLGFQIDHDSRQSIDSVYGHQVGSLLKFTYGKETIFFQEVAFTYDPAVTQFWTARKI